MSSPDSAEFYASDFDAQVSAFIGEHREMLLHCLDGMTESEARESLVPSKTTLLGLVKHASFVERVWFVEARTGLSRAELGIAAGPDESFDLDPGDTVASVRRDFVEACADSREAVRGATADTVWSGNRRGPLTLRWIQLHVLREHAQHCGHADVLREQIVAARGTHSRGDEAGTG